MDDQSLKKITDAVAAQVQITVNGKIDKMREQLDAHNSSHEKDMQRMMPIIEAFEQGSDDLHAAKRGGKLVLWAAGTVITLGGAYLTLKEVLTR